ncbi:MAG TPA: patatin-like phospholipase family protein [Burkholderiales bacterium]|jgi:predicted acylesterase/phospholipase RssA|nr:patatin-like phospholipase family protein [Burkholderiales bacterium]
MKFRFLKSALIGVCIAGCASEPERAPRTTEDLFAARAADDLARANSARQLSEQLVQRAERKVKAAKPGGPRPTIDALVISGGGDWGAFGAGVLKGWGQVKGDLARPQFDVVTGVSTGAMIAPFAFLGDDDAIERIVRLYRNPKADWTQSRGLVFFWPSNPSFFALPGLEREMRESLDRPMLERIAAEGASGRALVVNTTNIDLGDSRPWDIIAEARTELAGSDPGRVQSILLASAGIPAVFPAREIGTFLYVDGAITGNILYGGRIDETDSLAVLWRKRNPSTPLPRIRYWVIFNNQFRFPPQVTAAHWPDIMSRATIMATQTGTVSAMRHLFSRAELIRLKQKVDVEVRVMSVPESFVPSVPGTFQKEVMNALADLGEKMGADPASWRTEPPD